MAAAAYAIGSTTITPMEDMVEVMAADVMVEAMVVGVMVGTVVDMVVAVVAAGQYCQTVKAAFLLLHMEGIGTSAGITRVGD